MSTAHCGWCGGPSPLGYYLCDDCDQAVVTEWPISIGHAIARFVRRSEVAELVLEARRGTRHARPCIDGGAENCGCCVGSSRTAIDALARLAGGES